jgi:hypothetical protein
VFRRRGSVGYGTAAPSARSGAAIIEAVTIRWAAVALASVSACGDGDASNAGSSEGSTAGTTTGVSTSSGGDATASTTTSEATSSSADSAGTTGTDALPPAPTLWTPQDGAIDVPLETALCWNQVEDPEGEPLRYRVFVDDIELTQGGGEPPGYEGPCTPALTFAHEQSYVWRVRAFEVDDPARESEDSASWNFTVVGDGVTHSVFEDDFEADRGWEVGGDASQGEWVRGDPDFATHLGASSQPTACAQGQSCFFTGQNLAGAPDDDDVAGGATVLTSPPFDLGGAAAATVQLTRFFYESDAADAPHLRIELLVPNAAAPSGYDAFALEQLASTTALVPENLWTPREYATCGPPMVDGSRLRITASDPGNGILEAAIDAVSVHAHDFVTVCGVGEGSICDPKQGATACPGELVCCAQGSVNEGVYRCAGAVASLDPDAPPPTPDSPGNGPLGCDAPDITIDPAWIMPVLTDIMVQDDTCELLEGCVTGVGWRTILRFDLATPNIGSSDLALGIAANAPDVFHFSECHNHYHLDNFAIYELRDAGGVVASGHKQAFCLLDTYSWAWPNAPGKYDCANQGISRGFADLYEADLPCQWIDVTDVPPGDYTLRAHVNPTRSGWALPLLVERDYGNNMVEVPVTLP